MNLSAIFERARSERRAAFIPYVMAGYPDVETTKVILQALHESGADFVELGVPYGDPLADGPTIAAAGARALRNGVDIDAVLQIAAGSPLPVVLFTYFNPVMQYGLQRFAEAAKKANIAGVIVPDLAFEECTELSALLKWRGIDMPLLVAPSTPLGRAALIASAAGGFVYVVSRFGVTGAKHEPNFESVADRLSVLKAVSPLPLVVGFGLANAEQVRKVCQTADGVIIGSAILDAYDGPSNARDKIRALEVFCRKLRNAITAR